MAHNSPGLKAPAPLRAFRTARLTIVVDVALPSIRSAQLAGIQGPTTPSAHRACPAAENVNARIAAVLAPASAGRHCCPCHADRVNLALAELARTC
jgi:hypothetical protein